MYDDSKKKRIEGAKLDELFRSWAMKAKTKISSEGFVAIASVPCGRQTGFVSCIFYVS